MSKPRNRVEASIEMIRRFYRIGQESRREQPKDNLFNQQAVEHEAERRGLSTEIMRKARQIVREYTREELNELFAMMRKEGPNCRFGRTHLIRLLSVPKKRRAGLQRRAIDKRWTTARLQIEINRLFGTRKDGGRTPFMLSDLEGIYAQLEGMAEQWYRYGAALSPDPEKKATKKKKAEKKQAEKKRIRMKDLKPRIQKLLKAALDAMSELQKEITKELNSQYPERIKRLRFRKQEGY